MLHVTSTRLTAAIARASGLLLRTDNVRRRRDRLEGSLPRARLRRASPSCPLLAGGASSASAASAGTTITASNGPFGTMLVRRLRQVRRVLAVPDHKRSAPQFWLHCNRHQTGPRNIDRLHRSIHRPERGVARIDDNGRTGRRPRVSQKLLGSVKRPGIGTQVTYAGHPLYLFDDKAGPVGGEGWFEPSLPPWHGEWYPVSAQGLPVAWAGMLAPSPIAGKTVVAAQLYDGNALHDFPVYSLSSDTASKSECNAACATAWPPLLTSGTPGVTAPLKTGNIGTLRRADGTIQVTYRGKPLYLYSLEGVIKNAGAGHAAGNGNAKKGPDGGTFSLVTP